METRISLLVHGSWSEWEEWSECPATCGQGTQTRIRHCNSPAPEYGGDDCDVKGSTNSDSRNCKRPDCTSMFYVSFITLYFALGIFATHIKSLRLYIHPLLLLLVQAEYYSSAVTQEPVITGTIPLVPNALYGLKVEILETDFDTDDEFVSVAINGDSVGICRPSCEGCCNWHYCSNLNKTIERSDNNSIFVQLKYSEGVNIGRFDCSGKTVGSRIEFELLGRELRFGLVPVIKCLYFINLIFNPSITGI